jgi:dolichol-phosphate mannosyltransferase
MDADLQDPPELIHLFFEKWKEGNQIVYGIREEREGSKLLSLVYNVFYQLQELFTDISIPKHAGDFCLMDKMVVSILNQDFPEKRKFLRGLRAYVGFKSIGIPFSRPKRTTGSSKYTLKKLFRLASDGVFDFSLVPLRISTITGLLFALIGCIFGIFFMMHRIFDFKVFGSSPLATPGIATVVVGGSFILSLILVILGIIGEYLGRIYYEIKARPQYIIKSRQNFTL